MSRPLFYDKKLLEFVKNAKRKMDKAEMEKLMKIKGVRYSHDPNANIIRFTRYKSDRNFEWKYYLTLFANIILEVPDDEVMELQSVSIYKNPVPSEQFIEFFHGIIYDVKYVPL